MILESIYANILYIMCVFGKEKLLFKFRFTTHKWYKRFGSYYGEVFNFVLEHTATQHVYTSAYLPCICDENNNYNAQYCMSADNINMLEFGKTIAAGRSFTLNLITLDVVGSTGFSRTLYAEVFSIDFAEESFQLAENQNRRSFNAVNKQCISIDFTIYAKQSVIPKSGILQLTVLTGSDHFKF